MDQVSLRSLNHANHMKSMGLEPKVRAAIVAVIGILPLIAGIGFLIGGDEIGFILLAGVSLFPIAIAAGILVASESKEKWFR